MEIMHDPLDLEAFGARLDALRLSQRYRLGQFAQLIGYKASSGRQLREVLKGSHAMKITQLYLAAQILEVSADELLGLAPPAATPRSCPHCHGAQFRL